MIMDSVSQFTIFGLTGMSVAFGLDVCLRAIVFAFGLGIYGSSSSVQKINK